MFISITHLNIEATDNSTFFSVTPIDSMHNPEESIKFDIDSNYDNGKWIQVRNAKK